MLRLVDRITQSPMNPQQWALDLECGHEVWVTAKRRPTKGVHNCPKCSSATPNK